MEGIYEKLIPDNRYEGGADTHDPEFEPITKGEMVHIVSTDQEMGLSTAAGQRLSEHSSFILDYMERSHYCVIRDGKET